MAITIKIFDNQKLYFDGINPCSNFIWTQNWIPNNEIIFLYSAFWGSLQTEASFLKDLKKVENEYEMKLNVKKVTVNHFLNRNSQ